ncbi:hypothetical protein JW930_07770 [Candidatus Woesearchaeota archaeon]|nr:hypothetical protein [Candidatus Woesearchaeota archaeon]
MGFLKNLYFDFSGIKNILGKPFKKKEKLKVPKPETSTFSKELPSLSRGLVKKEVQKEEQQIHESEKKAEVPNELPKITKKYEAVLPKINVPPSIPVSTVHKTVREPENKTTFFRELLEHINKEDKFIHENMPKDKIMENLLVEMKSFWNAQRYELDKELESNRMKEELRNRILELHNLEIEWQKLQLNNEKIKDEVEKNERVIEGKILELKDMFRNIHFSQEVDSRFYFYLSGGKKLKNLQDLIDSLEEMEDNIFNYHVNEKKNDFARWIQDVMGLDNLADNIAGLNSKEEILEILNRFKTK